jgi:hypothetical protein
VSHSKEADGLFCDGVVFRQVLQQPNSVLVLAGTEQLAGFQQRIVQRRLGTHKLTPIRLSIISEKNQTGKIRIEAWTSWSD